jgi:3-phenylpropionate/cinnamic acid dioxygenase small subunit
MLDTNAYFYLRQLVCAYPRAVDRRDYATLQTLFPKDAQYLIPHLNLNYENSEEIVAGIKQMETMFEKTYHTICNHTFEIDGTDASGEVYCIAMHFKSDGKGGTSKYDMGIRYQDKYVKQGEKWLFARRELLLDWENTITLSS